jgi:hypothetical protein
MYMSSDGSNEEPPNLNQKQMLPDGTQLIDQSDCVRPEFGRTLKQLAYMIAEIWQPTPPDHPQPGAVFRAGRSVLRPLVRQLPPMYHHS